MATFQLSNGANGNDNTSMNASHRYNLLTQTHKYTHIDVLYITSLSHQLVLRQGWCVTRMYQ